MRKLLTVAALVFGSLTGAQAQTVSDPAKAYDAVLSIFESQCVGVAKAMPADKFNFTPASLKIAGAKYDGVYTFAGEVKHLAQANYYFYSTVSGIKPDVDMQKIGTLTGKDEIVAALQASFAFGHKALATLTPANAFEAIKPVDGITTRGTLADFAVAHGFDHYGQMVEYLRMYGIIPPGSK